jgi:hypothetical protein
MKLTLDIAGKETTLTEAQARRLWADLHALFGSKEPLPVYVPYPVQPWQPLDITFNPIRVTCGDPLHRWDTSSIATCENLGIATNENRN